MKLPAESIGIFAILILPAILISILSISFSALAIFMGYSGQFHLVLLLTLLISTCVVRFWYLAYVSHREKRMGVVETMSLIITASAMVTVAIISGISGKYLAMLSGVVFAASLAHMGIYYVYRRAEV